MVKSENGEIRFAGDAEEILQDFKHLVIAMLELVPFRFLAKAFRDGIGAFADQSYDKEETHKVMTDEQSNLMKQVRKMNLSETKKFVKEKKLGGK